MKRLPLFILFFVALQSSAHEHLTIQEQLGYPADAKLLIIHADDLGVAHSQNMASFQAMEEGIITSASVMMPTPWAKEAVLYAIENPEADIGVHITLTAEWDTYRWGPMLGADTTPSLVDEHGHFHASVAAFAQNAKLEEVEAEVRAQIEAAREAGIEFTHLDGHMGSMLATDEIAQLYFRLGKEYGVPVRLHQHHGQDSENAELREAVVQMPGKATSMHGASPSDFPDGMAESYNDYLRQLQPGLNLLVLHLGFDDAEMQAITVNHPLWGSQWRQADFDWSMSEEAKAIVEEEGIILVDWRLVKEKLFDKAH
ncbi:polysaccharide deacetylase family protein [Pelagicoccus sp. SDUM812002]|uniref:polysaccharide deacetylase family protein n=1 Tax=Pelagicoccus sp. SDUM812002 TaxID=3041266 RepID=UPI00280C60F2|nr:polysaccharide deacetylase family protein [Pelagicoccus sp. SDUM812002]MDQ8185030.1 polysaccharide deacetylase family protein [Pelagicoccus sp. SDUM812002]